jgi:O2-independent ubiquinone biosynthesis accessory factor UbiT
MLPVMATETQTITKPWLRRLPPPQRWAPLLALLPQRLRQRAFERAAMHVLATAFAAGAFADLRSRRIGIEVEDLGLRFVVEVLEHRLVVLDPVAMPESCVRGTLTDLLQMVSRRADADTLFFQRRLTLTGDVDLGLRLRNLLDQLPWEQFPLGARVLLHHGAQWAEEARAAYRAGQPERAPAQLSAPEARSH